MEGKEGRTEGDREKKENKRERKKKKEKGRKGDLIVTTEKNVAVFIVLNHFITLKSDRRTYP